MLDHESRILAHQQRIERGMVRHPQAADRGSFHARRVRDHVGRCYGVSVTDLRSELRYRHVAWCRHVIAYIGRRQGLTLLDISLSLNRADHTTSLNGVNQVKRRIKTDPYFAREVAAIEESLNAPAEPAKEHLCQQ